MFIQEITQKQCINNVQIYEYTMKNEFLEVRFLNIGGAITKISMKEDDSSENLVLAYENWKSYLSNGCYLGVLVGRTSNRIKDGRFAVNGTNYQVDLNNGPNNLHGGHENLSHTLLNVEEISNGYRLSTILPHQENGFPGNLTISVMYTLEENKFNVTYEATTDQDTIVNLTQHTYFNLSGNLKSNIYDHQLQIKANAVAEVDENSSFTTKEIPVAQTLFDFNTPRIIEPKGFESHSLFERTSGYDHLYLLTEGQNAATFKDIKSGRKLNVSTTSPSMQFYAANFITSNELFENNRVGEPHLGACFETHLVPYNFESQVLKPGETYNETTTFEFTI